MARSAFDVMSRADDQREQERYEKRLERLAEPAPVDPYWERPARDEDYCEWSDLRKDHCAGKCCLDHFFDADLLEASKP